MLYNKSERKHYFFPKNFIQNQMIPFGLDFRITFFREFWMKIRCIFHFFSAELLRFTGNFRCIQDQPFR